MNIIEILSLESWSDRLTELKQTTAIVRKPVENRKYYDGEHDILTDPERQDFPVPTYELDADGQPLINEQTGKAIQSSSKTVKRSRTVLHYPEQIVETAVAMVYGKAVDLILTNSDKSKAIIDAFEIFKIQWNKAKLDSFNKQLARTLFIETYCAELMFMEEGDTNKDIKIMLLSRKNGDEIWIHKDDNRRADALTRIFTKRALVEGKAVDMQVTQIYTAEKTFEKLGAAEFTETPNPYKKNVWVFYEQDKPEFENVKPIITKQEYLRSQHSDVNKRVGNPGVVIKGVLSEMPTYDADVKIFKVAPSEDQDGKVSFGGVELLEAQTAPESIRLEKEWNDQDIYRHSWPDLSWLLSGIKAGALSGTAIKLMFTQAEAKIANKQEVFEDLSRRISVMKAILQNAKGGVFDQLEISVKFNSILPENLVELVDMYSTAKTNGITSQKNAVGSLSLNENPAAVMAEIQAEQGLIDANSATL